MIIRGNEKLTEYITQKEKAFETFSEQLNILNEEFQPIINKLAKQKKDRIYILGLIFSVILFGTIAFLLYGEPFPDYVTYPFYGATVTGLGFMIFITFATNKKLKTFNLEWKVKYQILDEHRKKSNEYLEKAAGEALNVICLNTYYEDIEKKRAELSSADFNRYFNELLAKEKLLMTQSVGKEALPSDVLEYYQVWGKKATSAEQSDYELFLESRKKRHLGK